MRHLIVICTLLIFTLPAAVRGAGAGVPDFTPVENLVNRSISERVFPSASIAVIHQGRVIFHRAFGRLTYDPASPEATTGTIYDIASLTKPVVTTSITMQLVERDSLDLDAPVSRYLPSFGSNGKQDVTVRQLLQHTSGLRAHRFFIKTCTTPQEVYQAIDTDTLITRPGTRTRYSDLGFITLGRVIKRITGNSLEKNFDTRFRRPLAMHNTMFTPPTELSMAIAPTEQDTSWTLRTPRPLVHDHNTALLGGIAGHAGLFSTTRDLIIFTSMMLNEGRYGTRTFFSPETLATFTRRYDNDRGLGWDLRSIDTPSSAGDHLSPSTYGHLGFTGTSIWIDPEQDIAIITLTNRVHPTSSNKKIRAFRPRLHNTIMECIESQKEKNP
ncbi:beta-lactamase family protein [Prosthecochloris sp. N3]|uniref:Beta-lactamase family protein n=1 Tax=Prosthecochloris ethylica TaxID=2743976 RepID=A0ABR9XUN7_9CHLB|nr:serine hydrolase domain-containing protein [Prosthecochloris ethylica]MBF0587338.1 beta-lactamase family protein [Prosthecochloris ethylica]MBF0637633.1 beta-lactamase family protein [Prosthecochloris ethylica]NUK48264.1 beta-lactamase family protein [Prosthecochloris ethylica]